MLLPHEIRKKEFSHAIGGYAKSEVKSYLEYVAAGYEKLRRENDELSRKLEAACAGLDEYQKKEAEANANSAADSVTDKAVGERIASLRKGDLQTLEAVVMSLRAELSAIETLLSGGTAPATEIEQTEEIDDIEKIEYAETVAEDVEGEQTDLFIAEPERTDMTDKDAPEEEIIEDEPIEDEAEDEPVSEKAELTWGELEDALTAAFSSLTPTDEEPDPDQIKIDDGSAACSGAADIDSIDIGDIIIDDDTEDTDGNADGDIELAEDDIFADTEPISEEASVQADEDDTAQIDSFMSDFIGDGSAACSGVAISGAEDVYEFVIPTAEPAITNDAVAPDTDEEPAKIVYKKRTYKICLKSKKKSAPVTDEEAEALLEALKERYKSYDAKAETADASDEDDEGDDVDAGFDTQNYDEFNYFFADTTEKIDTVPMNNDINDI